jgi:hypothetical protein
MNFYLDDERKKLLNDNKAEFGQTEAWSQEDVSVTTTDVKSTTTFHINRLTGAVTIRSQNWQEVGFYSGTCKKAPNPTQKF